MNEAMNGESTYTLIEEALQAANSGNHMFAEQLLLRSYGTLEAQVLHNAELRTRVLHLLANSYRDRGRLAVAREFYEKAMDALKKERLAVPPLALCEDIYIQALCENDVQLALQSQQDLLVCLQKSNCQPIQSRLRNLLRLCALYWSQAKYFEAEKCLREYRQLARERNKLGKKEDILLLCSLALLSARVGKFAEAESLYKEAIYAGNELQLMSNSEQAEMLRQLGTVLCSEDKQAEAQSTCSQAAELSDKVRCDEETISGNFRAIADFYCKRGCLQEAERYCGAALDVFEFGSKIQNDDKIERLLVILRRLALLDDVELLEKQKAAPAGIKPTTIAG